MKSIHFEAPLYVIFPCSSVRLS